MARRFQTHPSRRRSLRPRLSLHKAHPRRRRTIRQLQSRSPRAKTTTLFPRLFHAKRRKKQAPRAGKLPILRRNPRRTIIRSPRTFLAKPPRMPRRLPNRLPRPPPRSDLPPGVSSSSSSSSGADLGEPGAALPQEPDPVRAKKDIDVGGFYLKKGDYKGALQRFKDATASDPTDVDAIFGLAETQRMLKNNAEAERNYQMYLRDRAQRSKGQTGSQGTQRASFRQLTKPKFGKRNQSCSS